MKIKTDWKGIAKKYLKILNPVPPIGGLEITDSELRFLLIRETDFVLASLKLSPGIVVGGSVQDGKSFRAALAQLHVQISAPDLPVHCIVILPPNAVYLQSFSVPALDEIRLAEAAKLNLQMISPIDIKNAYYSWQKISEVVSDSGQVDLLGAFTESSRVDAIVAGLEEAHFVIAAIEFPALSLTRTVSEFRSDIVSGDPHLIVHISPDGVATMIIKNRNLYFNDFNSWKTIQEEIGGTSLDRGSVKNFLAREISRMLNFYTGRFGGLPADVVTFSEVFQEEIAAILPQELAKKVKLLSLKDIADLHSVWFTALGAARRGTIPRSRDTIISLTNKSAETRYVEERGLNFVRLWQKILLAIGGLMLFFFIAVDSLLARTEAPLATQLIQGGAPSQLVETKSLEAQATQFNHATTLALKAKTYFIDWTPFVRYLESVAGDTIGLTRIGTTNDSLVVLGAGSAPNIIAVVAFKDRLSRDQHFEGVSLPVINLKPKADGTIDFSFSFKLKSLEL